MSRCTMRRTSCEAVAEVAVRFQVLGNVEVTVDGAPVDVGHLTAAVRPGGAAGGGEPPRCRSTSWWTGSGGIACRNVPRGTLHSYLSRLRRSCAACDGRASSGAPVGYLLTVDPMAVDMHRFRGSSQRPARPTATPGRRASAGAGVVAGDAFATLDTPWLNAVRETLHRQRLAAELDRNDLALRGEHAALLAELSTCAAAHPLDERLTGQLMLALYRCGRQADALALSSGSGCAWPTSWVPIPGPPLLSSTGRCSPRTRR